MNKNVTVPDGWPTLTARTYPLQTSDRIASVGLPAAAQNAELAANIGRSPASLGTRPYGRHDVHDRADSARIRRSGWPGPSSNRADNRRRRKLAVDVTYRRQDVGGPGWS